MWFYVLTSLHDIELKDCKFTTSKPRALKWLRVHPKSGQVYGYDVGDDGLTIMWAVRYTIADDGVLLEQENCDMTQLETDDIAS